MYSLPDELEQPEIRRDVLARDDEHALFARADRDVGALLDDALLDDLAALYETDAKHLRARSTCGIARITAVI